MEKKDTKVLIIDDDPFIGDMYILKLRERGFQAESVLDGKTGLEKIKEFKPDVVLVDIVMPGIDGFELLKALQQFKDKDPVKIILLTNLGEKQDVERGLELGADDYLIKAHFTPSEVADKVEELLKKPRVGSRK